MSKSERTPLTAPLNSAASTLLGGAHKVDEKAADVLTGTLTACDKFIAVILYGHIVKRRGPGICQFTIFDSILIIIHSTPWRMLMHGIMVAALILLANQVRSIDEMFLTKHVSDTFVHNHFDSSHNTFLDIRRAPDVWEWGNNVLWPGLLGNNGPCQGDFTWSLVNAPVGSIATSLVAARQCVEGWPDGTGSFSTDGKTASSYTPLEWAKLMDDIDWTEGMSIRTVRVKESADGCQGQALSAACRPELVTSGEPLKADQMTTAPFGIPSPAGSPLPFRFSTADRLGSYEVHSSHTASAEVYIPGDGYDSIIIPFFAETFLAEARGPATSIPFDTTSPTTPVVTRSNGKVPNYFCVRISMDGYNVTQLCDPNDAATGRTTGVVRAAAEAFWNDLKRAHFIDMQTRAMVFTMMLRANSMGVMSRTTFLLEFTAAGAILPSFQHKTTLSALMREEREDPTAPDYERFHMFHTWQTAALGIIIYFTLMEFVEVYSFGVVAYISSMWNVADLVCIVLYYMFYAYSLEGAQYFGSRLGAVDTPSCSTMCQTVGFFDNNNAFNAIVAMRYVLSTTCLLVLLRTIKFINHYFSSTSLLVKVLAKGRTELGIFTVIFLLSVFAFSFCFWLRLGTQIEEFSSPTMAFRTTFRALFGDYDLDTISDQFNPLSFSIWLFLFFAFLNIFIILSIFLAILGEAQGAVRDEEEAKKDEEEKARIAAAERRRKKLAEREAAGTAHEAAIDLVSKPIEALKSAGKVFTEGVTEAEMEKGDPIFFLINPNVWGAIASDYLWRIKQVHNRMAKASPASDDPDATESTGDEEAKAPHAMADPMMGKPAEPKPSGAGEHVPKGGPMPWNKTAEVTRAVEKGMEKQMALLNAMNSRLEALESQLRKR